LVEESNQLIQSVNLIQAIAPR